VLSRNLVNEEAMAQWGLSRQKQTNYTREKQNLKYAKKQSLGKLISIINQCGLLLSTKAMTYSKCFKMK
jgi:hypothetical protein